MNRFRTYYLYFTVFVTGAVILVIEILGTRVLAPFYGSSIFVWSSLITVTLGALAFGYWIGGKIADKYHSASNFYTIVILVGISIAAFLQYKKFILLFADNFGIQYGPLIAALILFSPSLFLLGTMTPYAIRLLSVRVEFSGETAGRVPGLSEKEKKAYDELKETLKIAEKFINKEIEDVEKLE